MQGHGEGEYGKEHMSLMVRINTKVTPRIYEFFKAKKEETGIHMSALIYMALEEYVDEKEKIKNMARDNKAV